MDYMPFCQTEVQFIKQTELEHELLKITGKNLILVLSSSGAERYRLSGLPDLLSRNNNLIWINTIRANPKPMDLYLALQQLGKTKIASSNIIIAIGGGSSIDLAKGISAFYDNRDALLSADAVANAIEHKTYRVNTEFPDILAVPTTAGTGSELTQWATIWNPDDKKKYSIDHIGLQPKKAFIVPELTMTLSKETTLSTGLDALSHAIEAYWSKHTDPLVQELAYRAIQIILEYLPNALNELTNPVYREALCRASVLAGMAFSKTRTTACHSISYPLTMLYHIPHGIAAAMTLGEVSARNKGNFPNDEKLYSLFDTHGGLQNWLDQVSSGITLLRLSAFSIDRNDIDAIVKQAVTKGRMDNNPVDFTVNDIRGIISRIY